MLYKRTYSYLEDVASNSRKLFQIRRFSRDYFVLYGGYNMKNDFRETLVVMGGIFLITLILNLFSNSIDFYNRNATIAYFAFGVVYYCIRHFSKSK